MDLHIPHMQQSQDLAKIYMVVLRCGDGQEMREGELWVCGLVKTGGALSACVIGHNHYPLSFFTPVTASTW
eukprot:COSAG01_NODE_1491_length_10131_cov_5.872508_1_plen_71_part_00